MKRIDEAFYDTNTKSSFIGDSNKINEALHITWLGLLSVRQITGNSFRIKKLLRSDKDLNITSITDDNNDLSLIVKLANDAGIVNNITAKKMILFLRSLKLNPDDPIDETIIRDWFDGYSKISLPNNVKIRAIRKQFVDGKTLADCIFDVWSYLRMNKKVLADTNVFQFVKHTMYFPPKGSIIDKKGGNATTAATPASTLVSAPSSAQAPIKRGRGRPRKIIDPNQVIAQVNIQTSTTVNTPTQTTANDKLDIDKINAYILQFDSLTGFKNLPDKNLINDRNFIASRFFSTYHVSTILSSLFDLIKEGTGESDRSKIVDFFHDELEDLLKMNLGLINHTNLRTSSLEQLVKIIFILSGFDDITTDFFENNIKEIYSSIKATNGAGESFLDQTAYHIWNTPILIKFLIKDEIGSSVKDLYSFVYKIFGSQIKYMNAVSTEAKVQDMKLSNMRKIMPYIEQKFDIEKIISDEFVSFSYKGVPQKSSRPSYSYRSRPRSSRVNSTETRYLPFFVLDCFIEDNIITEKDVYLTVKNKYETSAERYKYIDLLNYFGKKYRETLDVSLMSDAEYIDLQKQESNMNAYARYLKLIEHNRENLLDNDEFITILESNSFNSLYDDIPLLLSKGEGVSALIKKIYSYYSRYTKLFSLILKYFIKEKILNNYNLYPTNFWELYDYLPSDLEKENLLKMLSNKDNINKAPTFITLLMMGVGTGRIKYDYITQWIKDNSFFKEGKFSYGSEIDKDRNDALSQADWDSNKKFGKIFLIDFILKEGDNADNYFSNDNYFLYQLLDNYVEYEEKDWMLSKELSNLMVVEKDKLNQFILGDYIPTGNALSYVYKSVVKSFIPKQNIFEIMYNKIKKDFSSSASLQNFDSLTYVRNKSQTFDFSFSAFMDFLSKVDPKLFSEMALVAPTARDLFSIFLTGVPDSIEPKLKEHAVNLLSKENNDPSYRWRGDNIQKVLTDWSKVYYYKDIVLLFISNTNFRASIKSARRVWKFIDTVFTYITDKDTFQGNKPVEDFLEWFEKNNRNKFSLLMTRKLAYMKDSIQLTKILEDKHNPLPLSDSVKSDPKLVLKYLSVNDRTLDLDETNFKDLLPPKDKGENLFTYMDRLTNATSDIVKAYNDKIPDPKVIPTDISDKDLYELSLDFNHRYNIKRHGDLGFKILKVFESNPSNKQEFEDFYKELQAAGKNPLIVAEPLFHGTGTLAANMILRYFFLPSIRGDSVKVFGQKIGSGDSLGNGVYLAPGLDKALSYMTDNARNYNQAAGNIGYILQCKAILYDEGVGFNQAKGSQSWKSNEYCIHTDPPTKAVLVEKVYYGMSIPIRELEDEWAKRGITTPPGASAYGDLSTLKAGS